METVTDFIFLGFKVTTDSDCTSEKALAPWNGEGNGNPLQYSCLENPETGEPGGLLSMGLHRVGHD